MISGCKGNTFPTLFRTFASENEKKFEKVRDIFANLSYN